MMGFSMIGQTVSHYRIVEKLGEGGTGVVYLARDETLMRNVAVKLLSSSAADEEQRRRFHREAQTASSLNHPHIASVYEAGTHQGQQYIVTEFVDGWTLDEWTRRENPSTRRILHLMSGVADALACAHAAGIVHRDIKPQNILVARDGYAKLVDFGLAKPSAVDPGSSMSTETMTGLHTSPGMLVGTLAYMSPEQAAGKATDVTSDVFSFGLVLYELLAGSRAFSAKSNVDLLYAIIHDPHRPLAEVRPDLPTSLVNIVEKALEKEPGDRYQYARELATDLRRSLRERTGPAPAALNRPKIPKRFAGALAGVLVLTLGIAAWQLYRSDLFWSNPLAAAQFTRFTDFEGAELDATISPDGKVIGFLSDRDGSFDVWIGRVGTNDFVNLTKGQFPELLNDQVSNLGISQDGAHLLVKVNEAISGGPLTRTSTWMIPTIGGTPRRFIDGLEAVWSPKGNQIAFHTPAPGDPIFVAAPDGSNPRQIYIDQPAIHCHYLKWSLDGRYLYFARGIPKINMDIWRVPAAGGAAERITSHQSRVEYPTPIDDRTLLYIACSPDGSGPWLYCIDVNRRVPHRVSFGVEQYISVAASIGPRGRAERLVVTVANPSSGLWTVPIADHSIAEDEAHRLPLDMVSAQTPRFDSDSVVFVSGKGKSNGIWKYKDGSAAELWSTDEGTIPDPPAVSPDGKEICFAVLRAGREQMYWISSDGTGVREMAPTVNVLGAPCWSPDGKWIAAAGTDSGGSGLFKVPLDGSAPVRIADAIASTPVWSPDGRVLLFHQPLAGIRYALRTITEDQQPLRLPELWIAGSRDAYHFLPNGSGLVLLLGNLRHHDFWLLDFPSQSMRQLTKLKPGFDVRGFDISRDGKEIIFDRIRENADVVLIDLGGR